MAAPTAARLLAERALQMECGENCVKWAIDQLCAGKDGQYLVMLAGMTPPFNPFEIAVLRDAAFGELGIKLRPTNEALRLYAAELLRTAMADESHLRSAIKEIGQLAIADGYRTDLHDFHMLACAFLDLDVQTFRYPWPQADRSNIMQLARERSLAFVEEVESNAEATLAADAQKTRAAEARR